MDNLDVHPRIISALKKAHLHRYEVILRLSGPEIERQTKLSTGDVSILKTAVSGMIHKTPCVTALVLYTNSGPEKLKVGRLTTGCAVLDQFLTGGVLSRGITEIAGISASGKTQLCLQLGLTVQLPLEHGGLKGGAVYICTEDAFPNKRLYQMIQHFKKRTTEMFDRAKSFGDSIFIEHVADLEDLQQCISRKLPALLMRGLVKLVIIDSVAAVFRCDYQPSQMVKRAKCLGGLGLQLHKLNGQFNIPIICVNQVSDSFKEGEQGKVVPALGLTWANYVTTRIMLSRQHSHVMIPGLTVHRDQVGDQVEAPLRQMEIIFSPHLPKMTCSFTIDHEGVKGIR